MQNIMFKLKFLDAEHGNLFNLSAAAWYQIHLQPLYVKSLPENTGINLDWGSVLLSVCTRFPHITNRKKSAAIVEEHTQENLKSYSVLKDKRQFNMLVHTTHLVNDEHNSFTGLVPQTHLLPWRKTAQNLYYNILHAQRTTHVHHIRF